MKKNKEIRINYKIVVSLFLSMTVLFSMLSIAYLFLNKVSVIEKAQIDIVQANENLANEINGIVNAYYDEISDEIETIDHQDDYLTNQNYLENLYNKYGNKKSNHFLLFAYYEEIDYVLSYDGIQHKTTSFVEDYDINKYDQNVSFGKISELINDYQEANDAIIYHYKVTKNDGNEGNFLIFQSVDQFVQSFMSIFQNASNKQLYLMNNDGYFYYKSDDNYNNLYSLIGDFSTSFLNDVSINGSNHGYYNIKGSKYFLTGASMLSSVNDFDMYVLVCIDEQSVIDYYKSFRINAVIYVVITLICLLLLGFALLIFNYFEFNRFHLKKFNLLFSKVFCIVAQYNGKIILKNRKFIKTFDSNNEYKKITDLDIEEFLNHSEEEKKDIFRKLNSFSVKLVDNEGQIKVVRFVCVIKRGKYQYIGDYIENITRKDDRIYTLAYIEPLTKLENKNALIDYLSELLNTNHKKAAKKAIMYWDISEFKSINDTFGREFGDDVILCFINKLKQHLNQDDKMYSLGGDSIVILTLQESEYGMMYERCKKIYDEVIKPVNVKDNEIIIDAVCGVYNISDEDVDDANITPQEILSLSLKANQKAHSSNNRKIYIFDNSLLEMIKRESIIINDLKNAISKNEFVVYYQPQYDMFNNKVVGFEALLRWNNSKYINDSPFEYIKIAEKTNLIIKIGDIVIDQSFKAAQELYQKGYQCHISVNLSITQLMQVGFTNAFLKKYQEYNIPYDAISVEVTETLLITSFDKICNKLNQLRQYGIKIYIDDFGMGYSSLLYLNNLPVDYIKIDREFIMNLQSNKYSKAIVRFILDMANEIGISVVAEGVENQYQVNYLLKRHCQYIQGYIVSKAQSKEHLEELLNSNIQIAIKGNDEKDDSLQNKDKKKISKH
ncbi:MAG: EAL domain-containing protein [Erysipelotrichaceae bacterium]|nr:EAL domain-containing protein [Erysipelotrichaceae bacterium]